MALTGLQLLKPHPYTHLTPLINVWSGPPQLSGCGKHGGRGGQGLNSEIKTNTCLYYN